MKVGTKRTNEAMRIPILGYALLGLIHQKPSSGYDLRKIFAETAMGNYSSSPGAIYPALQKLESGAYIKGSDQHTGGLRRRRVYKITNKGWEALQNWLAEGVETLDVRRGTDEFMLRFSFLDATLGKNFSLQYLQKLQGALDPYIGELEDFLKKNRAVMPISAQLALECGIRGYRSMRAWAVYAQREYRELLNREPSKPLPQPFPTEGGLQ